MHLTQSWTRRYGQISSTAPFCLGCHSWAKRRFPQKKKEQQILVTAQRATERSLLGISSREHIQNEGIGEWNRVKEVIVENERKTSTRPVTAQTTGDPRQRSSGIQRPETTTQNTSTIRERLNCQYIYVYLPRHLPNPAARLGSDTRPVLSEV